MVVFIFVIVAVLAIAGVCIISLQRRRERDALQAPIPLILPVPASSARQGPQPTPLPKWTSHLQEATAQGQAGPVTRPWEGGLAIDPGSESDTSSTVRFRRPGDEAIELLPGRLEVLAGETRHKEIRLVRAPGERPEVILGRDQGDGPGHVALHSSTVSRRHARLAYENGEWKVANLSQTNPVVVNDEALLVGNGERALVDGDCLELGEVVLRFHAR